MSCQGPFPDIKDIQWFKFVMEWSMTTSRTMDKKRDFHMKREKRTRWKIVLIILFFVLLWFLFISKYSVISLLRNELEISKKQEQIEAYKQEREKLIVEKDKLEKGDKKTIEKKARELGLAKPGETIIRIREEGEKSKGE